MTSTPGPHLLGRRVEHDERSRSFPARGASDGSVRSRTWRHYGAVLDQGELGSCTGNATAQALNTTPLRVRGRVLREDDAVRIFSLATRRDGIDGNDYPPTDGGSTGLGAAKAAVELGLAPGYTHAFGLDHLLAGLQRGPAMVGTDWTEGMFTPDASGQVRPTGKLDGGHEYLCLGVDLSRGGRLLFLNSWGPSWGRRGRFWMTLADFDALLRAQGDATFLTPLSAA